uniref:Uncharacterized protein n=1 Tax=Cacopsylla melanoneura TaxID=428564 RepID=A0A8D8S058_9HEMI
MCVRCGTFNRMVRLRRTLNQMKQTTTNMCVTIHYVSINSLTNLMCVHCGTFNRMVRLRRTLNQMKQTTTNLCVRFITSLNSLTNLMCVHCSTFNRFVRSSLLPELSAWLS